MKDLKIYLALLIVIFLIFSTNHNLFAQRFLSNELDFQKEFDKNNLITTHINRAVQNFNKDNPFQTDYQKSLNRLLPSSGMLLNNKISKNSFYMTHSISQDGSGSTWVNDYKDTLFYDANFNQIRLLEYNWLNNNWTHYLNYLSEYDLSNRINLSTYQSYLNQQWYNDSSFIYTYDDIQKIITCTIRLWNNNWTNSRRYLYEYDVNDQLIRETYQGWANNTWMDSSLIEYTYVSTDKFHEIIKKKYINTSWQNYYRSKYLYNNLMLNIETDDYFWRNGAWQDTLKYISEYNNFENVVTQTSLAYSNGTWENSTRSDYTYDVQNNLKDAVIKIWLFNSWINTLKLSFEFDAYGNMTLLLLQHWNFISGWANLYRTMAYYSEITSYYDDDTSLKEFELFQNYPNPFNPSTMISWRSPVSGWQTLKIYDTIGNEVSTLIDDYKLSGTYEINFDASSMSSGVYFYRLQADSFVKTQKMILLK